MIRRNFIFLEAIEGGRIIFILGSISTGGPQFRKCSLAGKLKGRDRFCE